MFGSVLQYLGMIERFRKKVIQKVGCNRYHEYYQYMYCCNTFNKIEKILTSLRIID
jgi:hypothetical protein